MLKLLARSRHSVNAELLVHGLSRRTAFVLHCQRHRQPASDATMMAAAPIEEARRALAILANSPDGANEALLVYGHGFKRQTLAGLVRAGLATVERDLDKTGDKTREVAKMRITQAGRDALTKS
jgi:hypothetical protein